MAKMKIAELVLDFNLYPRADVDGQHVTYLRHAHEAGIILPPVIVDEESKRVIDGFHRVKMYRMILDETTSIEVIKKRYATEGEMLIEAMRYNAGHGRNLTRYDRAHCLLLAEKLHIPDDELAGALNMTIDRIGQLRVERIGTMKVANTIQSIPLKRTIRHMAGQRLTQQQAKVNQNLGGMNQQFYVNQLIMLIESGLLNTNDKILMARLDVLSGLIGTLPASAKKSKRG